MISCDLARLVPVGAMAVVSGRATGDAALWIMVILLFIVTLLDSPFKSGRSATLPDVLDGEMYARGMAVSQIALQAGWCQGSRSAALPSRLSASRPRCSLTLRST
jgi:hypothetical protein